MYVPLHCTGGKKESSNMEKREQKAGKWLNIVHFLIRLFCVIFELIKYWKDGSHLWNLLLCHHYFGKCGKISKNGHLICKKQLIQFRCINYFFRSSDHIQKKLKNFIDLIADFKKIVICHISGPKRKLKRFCIFHIASSSSYVY